MIVFILDWVFFLQVVECCPLDLKKVRTSSGEVRLVKIPPAYANTIWIKKGDLVILKKVDEGFVTGELLTVLMKLDQIQHIKNHGLW